ncbi:MAG: hypothetical protein M5U17_02015 [Ignavibacterium sp.]|nr:hypothetical protein [Ignavibacterium sp.]
MADENQVLTFKLVIDGKEATAAVQVAKKEFDELNASINKIQERPILKQFAKDLLLVNASAEEATTGIMDFIRYNEMTEPEIQSVIITLREEQRVLAVGSAQWRSHGQAIENLSNAYQRTIAQQRAFTGASSSARMAVSQLGFALGDASMIAVDFRMFLMSIGNNIPFIIQGLAQVSQEAKVANRSMGSFLKHNLDMSMKLVLGANALMFAVQVLPSVYKLVAEAIGITDDKIKELTVSMGEEEKKVRIQQIEYTSLLGVLGDVTQSAEARKGALETLNEKYPEYIKNLESENSNTEKIAAALKLGNEQFELKIKLAASERILQEYYNRVTQSEYDIQKLQETRKEIQRQFDEGNKSRGFSLAEIDADIRKLDVRKNAALNKVNEFNVAISKLNAGILDTGRGGGSGSDGSGKPTVEDPIKKLEEEYNQRKELNTLTNQSNQENISSTRVLVEANLKNNLTIVQRIALLKLLKQLDEDASMGRSESAGAKPESSKEFDAVQKKLKKLQEDSIINSITNIYERERATDELRRAEEEQYYKDALKKRIITEADYLKAMDLIKEHYAKKDIERDKEVFRAKIDSINQIVGAVQNTFSSLYDAAQTNASGEVKSWKEKEEKKLEAEREAALKHARTQAQRERINEQFDKRRERIEEEANKKAQEKLIVWFRLKQAADIASTTMTTYKAATAALEPPPVGLGPVWGWPLMATTIASGLANVALIAQQKLPGYKKGGAIVGEEGPEIIAPFQDYASGQSKLITMTMMTLRDELRSSRGSASTSLGLTSDYGDIKAALNKLNKHLDNGISARAYLDDTQAKKISARGKYLSNKTRL